MKQNNYTAPVEAGTSSRREFLKRTGKAVAGSALAGVLIPRVHAAEDHTIRLALIGCGGRGCGAVVDAYQAPGGPVKLTAMADLFPDRLTNAYRNLSLKYGDRMDVTPERRFVGFDAYQKAIDCLRPGDVALLTGYAGFRPAQLEYAVEKGGQDGIGHWEEPAAGPETFSRAECICHPGRRRVRHLDPSIEDCQTTLDGGRAFR